MQNVFFYSAVYHSVVQFCVDIACFILSLLIHLLLTRALLYLIHQTKGVPDEVNSMSALGSY